MRQTAVFVVAIALGAACMPEAEPQRIRQIGYFKDDAGNRVQTWTITPEVTRDDVLEHASAHIKTSGQLFASYYYTVGSRVPGDAVTLASTFVGATDVIFEGQGFAPWKYVYMEPLVGPTTFIDCTADPQDDLCRK